MPFSGRCGPLLLTRIVFFSHSCYTERDSLCGREENILIERLCRWSVPAFLLLEGALYLSFLALDLLSPGPLSTALKYAALLLCLLMALAGASRGGDRLVAGVRLIAGQVLQRVEIRDQSGVIIALPHVPDHLGRLQLRDDALQGGEAGEELLPLRLRAGAEFPKYDMSDHAIFSFR